LLLSLVKLAIKIKLLLLFSSRNLSKHSTCNNRSLG
jgi:hypothetical protein